jgi:predicted nucleotidyltransferase
MNIHIKDNTLFEQLNSATLLKVRVGSHMYKLNDEHSDNDYLSVYVPSRNERNSFSFTNHQLQYKLDGVDYNFVNIFNFIRNTINGDSTINFEVINDKSIWKTELGFLYSLRRSFCNYNIIRSYLGLARRDVKQMKMGNTDRDKNKKLMHAYRGLKFAENIFNGKSIELDEETHSFLVSLKGITDWKTRHEHVDILTDKIETLRKEVNTKLDAGKLTKFMRVDDQKELDDALSNLINSDFYNNKVFDYMDMSMIYDANENGISYEK